MELTRERVEIYANAHVDAEIRSMAKQLLAEMDKPKVWDGAPEGATDARVRWTDRNGVSGHNDVYSPLYTRTLPKSRIDEIAEEAASKWFNNPKAVSTDSLSDAIKSAILKDREEREAGRADPWREP